MERHVSLEEISDGKLYGLNDMVKAGCNDCVGCSACCRGMCGIHTFRPGFCRLFPLGRYYQGDSFLYFLQIHECRKENQVKVKVRNWIDTPDVRRYERFVKSWHNFQKKLQSVIKDNNNAEFEKSVNLFLLKRFYLEPYDEAGFYVQFDERLKQAELYLCSGDSASIPGCPGW